MPQYLPLGVQAAPASWVIPDSVVLDLELLFAHYDGSGAAGNYVPAVEITSDSGDTVGIMKMPSTVAAGASVEATWGPFLGASTVAAPVGVSLMAARVNIVGNQSIPTGDPGQIVTWGEAPIDTGSPTSFWSNTHPTRLTAPINGIYLPIVNLEFDTIPALTNLGCYLYKNGASTALEEYLYEFNSLSLHYAVDSYSLQAGHHNLFTLAAGDYLEVLAYVNNVAGVPANVNLIDLRGGAGPGNLNHYSSFGLICVAAI